MSRPRPFSRRPAPRQALAWLLLLLLAACASAPTESPSPDGVVTPPAESPFATASSTPHEEDANAMRRKAGGGDSTPAAESPFATASSTPHEEDANAIGDSTPESPFVTASSTPHNQNAVGNGDSTPASPVECRAQVCYYPALFLQRPIAAPGRDEIDVSYRFSTTQGGKRDPHHGVEMLNSQGTPVLAAAAGRVVVAGDDRKEFAGPYSYFYGNLVVIEHELPAELQGALAEPGGPLYTLYGHLSLVGVEVGQQVAAGQEIGQVGMSGVATGSHLHFEVRTPENTYRASSNPELWLAARPAAEEPTGALAGVIRTSKGELLKVPNIVIARLNGPGLGAISEVYVGTYEEKALAGRPPFGENFAAGDLPPGWYRISFVQRGFQNFEVEVRPGMLAFITFDLGE